MKTHINKSFILLLVFILAIIICLPAVLFSQEEEQEEYEYKLKYQIPLLVNSIEELKSFNIYWIDKNRMLYSIDRAVKMVTNPSDPSKIQEKSLTKDLRVLEDGTISHFQYIRELDVIILSEETPEHVLNIFDGKGEFLKTIAEDLYGGDFKAEYIEANNKILILISEKLLLYDHNTKSSTKITENVYDYKYYPETKEIIIFKNIDEENLEGIRKEFNLSILDINNLEEKFNTEKVTDSIYYHEPKKLFYSKSDTFHTASAYEIYYPDNTDVIQEIPVKIGYNDYLYSNRYDKVNTKEIKNKMSLKYSTNHSLYMWTQLEMIPSNKEEVALKTLVISENPYEENNIKYSINNILDYELNHLTNDLIIFYKGNTPDCTIIEVRNLNDFDNPKKITENSIITPQFFNWFKEKNIITYLEKTDSGYFIKCYDINNKKVILSKGPIYNTDTKIYVELIDNEILTVSYIDENNEGKSELYFLEEEKGFILDNSYYTKPTGSKETTASIETVTNDDGTSGLVLSFYDYEKKEEIVDIEQEEEEKKPITFGPYGIGVKGAGNLNSMIVAGWSVGIGYEVAIFFNMTINDIWLAELGIFFGLRNENFNPNANTGLLPNTDTAVGSNITGIYLLGRYTMDTFKTGFNEANDVALFIPFGLRLNYNIISILYINGASTGDFIENVNLISTDLFGGIGFTYYITDKMDIFAELLLIVNVIPSFYKPNFTTGSSPDPSSQIFGLYCGLQLSIGFSGWKF